MGSLKFVQRLLTKLGKSRKSPFTAAREWPYELDMMELESRVLYDAAPLDIASFATYDAPHSDGDVSVLMDLADKLAAAASDDANAHFTDWWRNHDLSAEQNKLLDNLTSSHIDLSQIQQTLDSFSPETTLESLEQLIADFHLDQPALLDESALPSPISGTHELILIDRAVENYQQLVDDLLSHENGDRFVSIIYIDETEDGIAQISRALSTFHELSAVHIVSHGQDGQLQLGNTLLDNNNLDSYSEAIASWQSALSDEADLLFYGCDLAGSADGVALIDALAGLTGADVAASDDLTGHATLGGDWDLEYFQGSIETGLAFSIDVQQDWHGLLSATETGSIIAVNTFTTDTQETNATGGKAVATNDNGDFVVVWQSKKQDVPAVGDYGVFAQVYDANGNPLTAEIPVNDFIAKDQMSPSVAMADDGSFVVVWTSEDQDNLAGTKSWGIYGMRFDAAGNPLDVPGSPGVYEFRINSYIANDQIDPAIGMSGNGDFVVTWTSTVDQAGPNSKSDIFLRRFDRDGNALDASDVLVNTQISFDQYDSSVDMNDAGQFVVSWTANGNQDGDGFGVYAQKFDVGGLKIGAEKLVNSETNNDQYDSSVAIADNGDFVVVWTAQQHTKSAGNDAIIAQLFSSNANRVGGEIVVNAARTAVDHTDASVSMAGDGQFVVSWTDVATKQIYYQEYSAAGTAQDQTLRVDTADTINQRNSSVALQDDGDFIVVWTGDGSGLPLPVYDNLGVFAQRFGFNNEAPIVDLPGLPITFYENDPPIIIDGGAIVTDVDSVNFNGGRLVIDYLAGGTANDRLAINNQGSGPGQIGVLASTVSYQGTTIGTFTGGTAATPLVITLNANASVAATEALARNITFENLPNDPDTSDRTVRFTLHDGDGGTSDPVTKTVSITLVNDAPNIQGITSKTITEDNVITFQNADLIQITDIDAGSSELRVTLSVTHGVINLNTTNNLTFHEGTLDGQNYLVFSGTLANINNALNRMDYVPTPLYVGTDQLIIHVDDQGNTGAGGAQTDEHIVDITINSDGTNDAPKNIKPANQTVIEDDQLVFSTERGNRLWVQDDSGSNEIHVTLEVLEGGLPSAKALLSLSDLTGLTFLIGDGSGDAKIKMQGTLDNINNALDGLVLESVGGPATLTLRIFTEDRGFQGVGGPQTDTDNITVNVLARNDAPVITAPDMVSTIEGSPLIFDGTKPIDIADPDATGDLQVSLSVNHGVLKLGSIAGLTFISGSDNSAAMTFKGNLSELDAALNNLRYTPSAGYAGPDNLQITVNDLGGVGAGGAQIDADTIEITVTSDGTNAAPINTVPATQNTAEEQPLELSSRLGNVISIADDAGTDLIQVTLEVNDGTLSLSNTVGTEFAVNTHTADHQELPQVAIDENGNYVVVWQSENQDGGGKGVYAQLFNSSGVKTGPELRINDNTAGDQQEPSVAMDKDGNFVVAWTGKGDAGADSKAVYARLFDAEGNALSGELLVNQHTPGDQSTPAVAMNWQTGDFVVTWQTKDQINEWDIFARQYSFDLLTIGNEFQVNSSTSKNQTDPTIDINDSGDFIIAWETNVLGDDNLEVYYRRFASTGAAIDLTERLASDNSTKNQMNASAAIDNSGNYAVVWQSKDQDYADDQYGIYTQIWNSAGAEIRNEFVVNDTLPRDQTNPAISASGDGDFIVSWQAKSDVKDAGFEIYAKRYDISGTPQGSEFLVNLTTNFSQENPDIALNRDGQFVVVWQSKDQDGSGQGIFGQKYKDVRSLNFLEGDGVNDARIVVEGTLNQINDVLDGLVYTPNVDFVGTDTLTITTNDQHATDPKTDIDAFNIVVGPINDAPTITNPGLQTISQDGTLTFNAGINEVRIDDVDNPATVHSVTLMAKHGDVTLTNIGGLASLTGNGTSLLTLSGTLANINAALDGMQFEAATGYAGAASIFLRVDDPGEPVAGDELTAADTILVQVVPDLVNDAPDISVPGPQRTAKNVALLLDSAINANAISINDDSAAGIIEVTLNVTNGTITLSDTSSGDINEYTIQTGDQLNTDVGIFADGGFVAVWESPNQDGNGSAIVAQRFNSAGQAMGDEFIVNSFVTGNQVGAAVATSANGNFVVTWKSPQDGSGNGVYGQLYDNAGNRLGSEFIINSTTAGEQQLVDVAMADDGGFVAVWQSGGNLDGSGEGIFAQRYDGNGVSLGDEFRVNTTTAGNQTAPAIAMSGATGDFIVTWQDVDNNGQGIFAQRFDKDGVPVGNQFLVNTTTLNDQKFSDVAMDDSGNFVIVWESANEDGSGIAIVARRYDSSGFAQGSGFVVNEFTAGNQVAPRVAMNAATGDFAVLWQSAGQDGDGDAVVGQRFDAAGIKVGSEFIVNSDRIGNQQLPSVAMNESGYIVAGFNGKDVNGAGIFVKQILPHDAIQFINGDGINDSYIKLRGTLADINSVLDGIVFKPNVDFVGVATVDIDVNDLGNSGAGGAMLDSQTLDIMVGNAPSVDLDADNSSGSGSSYDSFFTPGGGPIAIADVDTDIVNPARGTLSSMTVTISNLLDGANEVLAVNLTGIPLITVNSFVGGVLSLSGTDSLAHYELALSRITYNNLAATPTLGTRVLEVAVKDGAVASNIAYSYISYPNAPTDIAPDSFSVNENTNTTGGFSLGKLSTVDSDAGDSFTYSILAGGDGPLFTIGGAGNDELILSDGILDAETKNSYSVNIRVTDSFGYSYDETLTVGVNDLNEAPTAITPASFNIDENTDTSGGQSLGTLSATDEDAGDTFTYTIFGGADAGKFTIGGIGNDELLLTDGTLDHEAKDSYTVDVQVVDSGGEAYIETITVNVNDLNEAPTAIAPNNPNIDENTDTSGGVTVATLSTTDADDGDTFTYSIEGGADAALFSISGTDQLVFTSGILNHEIKDTYTVDVKVVDAGGLSHIETITLSVNDLNEAPTAITPNNPTIDENTDTSGGVTVATLSATDVDDGDTFTYSIEGGADAALFSISGTDQLVFTSGVLNHEVKDTYTVDVKVVDAGGLSHIETITLSVNDLNEAPTDISPNAFNVDEHIDTSGGYALGTLSATDEDVPESFTYSIRAGADGAFFTIGGASNNELIIDHGILNYEAKSIYSVNLRVTDSGGNSYDETLTINVNDLNDAPVLGSFGNPSLSTIFKDDFTNTGDTVATIIANAGGDLIKDADGDPEGIAVTGFDNTNGTWQYSTNGGTVWNSFASVVPPVSATSAVLLEADDLIRFVPNAGFVGNAGTITFRAWDGTDGNAGGAVGIDVSIGGLAAAYSGNSRTATIDVSDGVTATNDLYVTDEDTPLTISLPGVMANDRIRLPNVVAGATLEYDASRDVDGDGLWQDTAGIVGYDWALSGGVTRVSNPANSPPGISAAYAFNGTSGATMADHLQNLPGNPTDNSVTFEFWFRPNDTTIGKEILFDTGSSFRGTNLRINGSGANTTLEWVVVDTYPSEFVFAIADIDAEVASGEFIHVVATYDQDPGTVKLFINGVLKDSRSNDNVQDWANNLEGSGLGQMDGSLSTLLPAGAAPFEGQIAAMRFYEFDLTAAQVLQNYEAVAKLTVTAHDPTTANGVPITVNADGSFTYNPGGMYNYLADGETATDSFNYTVTNSGGLSDSAQVNFTITGSNDNPTIGTPITAGATEDGAVFAVDLLAGSNDVDTSDVLNVSALTLTGGDDSGVTIGANSLSIDPNAYNYLAVGESQVITYSYNIIDGHGGSVAQTATITITGLNDGPTVSSTVIDGATEDDAGFVVDLLAGSADADTSDVLNVSGLTLTGGDNSGVTIGANSLSVDPNAYNHLAVGESAVITYSYNIIDGHGGSVAQTATITITGRNDGPTVSSVVTDGATEDDAIFAIDLLAGSSDADNSDVLNVSGLTLTGGDNSGITIGVNSLSVDPNAYNYLAVGESAVITYSYNIIDGHGGSVAQTATITITGLNDGPTVSTSVTAGATEDDAVFAVDLLAGSNDFDTSDVLNVSGLTLTGGDDSGVTIGVNSLSVDPNAYNSLAVGESAVITYSYNIVDGHGGSVAQTATITITGRNDGPAVSFVVTGDVTEDDAVFAVDLLAGSSDADSSDVLNVSGLTLTGGDNSGITIGVNSLSVDPNAYNYLAVGESAVITYSYNIIDGHGGSVAQTATITITGLNDGPIVSSVVTDGGTEDDAIFPVDLLAGSSDADSSDVLNVSGLTLTGGDDSGISIVGNSLSVDPNAYNSLAVGESAVIAYSYNIIDGNGGSVAQTATITITGLNDGPTVSSVVTGGGTEDDAIFAVDLLAGSSDADSSDVLNVSGLTLTGGDDSGVTIGVNSLSVDPNAYNSLAVGESAVITYSYNIIDGNGGSVVQTATITITGLNDGPTVSSVVTDGGTEDGAIFAVDLLAGSSDADSSDVLNVSGLTLTGGDDSGISIVGNSLSVDPNAYSSLAVGESAVIAYSYNIIDGNGGSVAQTATITITGLNDGPTVSSVVTGGGTEDDAIFAVDLLAGSNDADTSDVLNVSGLTLTGGDDSGISIVGNSLSVDPSAYNYLAVGESAVITYSYNIIDGNGGSVAQMATITIAGVNDGPLSPAGISTAITSENAPFTYDVSGNFTDPDDNDVLTYSAQLAGGLPLPSWLSFDGSTGQFSGTPSNTDVGTITIEVTADDSHGGTRLESFDLTVDNSNDAPTDIALSVVAIDENTDTSAGTVVGTLSTTDIDVGDAHTYSIVGGADQAKFSLTAGNQLVLTDGVLDFETKSSYHVEIESTDLAGDSTTKTFTININDLNESPVVGDASVSVAENSLNGTIVANVGATDQDAGVNGDLSYAIIGGNTNNVFSIDALGNIRVNDQNELDFAATPGYILTVQVTDGGTPGLSDTATVKIDVLPTNDAAPAFTTPANISVAENTTAVMNVLATDTDVPAQPISYSISGGADQALFTIDSTTGELTFANAPDFENPADFGHDNVYEVIVTANDNNGLSTDQLISVTVTDVNERPIAQNDSFSVLSDQTLTENSGKILNNDSDPEKRPLSVTVVDDVDHGTLTISADGSFVYVPDSGFVGTDRFSYIVDDGTNFSKPATVDIDVIVGVGTTTTATNDDDNTDPGNSDLPPITPTVANINDDDDDVDAGPTQATHNASGLQNLPVPQLPESLPILAETLEMGLFDLLVDGGQSQSDLSMLSRSISIGLVSSNVSDDLIYLANSNLWSELDAMKDNLEFNPLLKQIVVSSLAGFSGALTVGYVLWIIRGGYLMASVLSSLPAWRFVDPLPILDFLDDADEDKESIQSILEASNSGN